MGDQFVVSLDSDPIKPPPEPAPALRWEEPPEGPVPDAARRAGMRDPAWRNRSGESCDYRLIIWHDPRRDEWLAQHHHN